MQVAERGLHVINSFSGAMDAQIAGGHLPPKFREAWAFSACLSLAATTVRIGPPPPTPAAPLQQPPPPPRQASLPPLPSGLHKCVTM